MLWALMLAFPFTYVANIAGWVTAEAGRQPWVIFGLLRTSAGASPASSVPSGVAIFTLLGFLGLYVAIGMAFPMFIVRIVSRGPDEVETPAPAPRIPELEPAK
jgi:cytochrome d ubiquinol oxidase subunit I